MVRDRIKIKIINIETRVYRISAYVTKFTLLDENDISYVWYTGSTKINHIELDKEYVVTMTKSTRENRKGELEVWRVNFK